MDIAAQWWLDYRTVIPQAESSSVLEIQSMYAHEMPPGGGGSGGRTEKESEPRVIKAQNLIGLSLDNTGFEYTFIADSNFSGTTFRSTRFYEANIQYSDFTDTNMRRADFRYARVHGCDFTHADLTRADFRDSKLNWSDFTRANLRNAQLDGADLSDADLKEARGLTYSQLKRALINDFTKLPPHLEKYREELETVEP